MKITKKNLTQYQGGCNGCNRGILDRFDGRRLIFPYNKIYEIKFKGIAIRICKDCLSELNKITNNALEEDKI